MGQLCCKAPSPDELAQQPATTANPLAEVGAEAGLDANLENAIAGGQKLRIISVNDCYLLDNFARLKTLIKEESKGAPNVITALPGDFLAPSLLSSLDRGKAMVEMLNLVGIDIVCFGNHESDVPYRYYSGWQGYAQSDTDHRE
jgi:2',3'-cyclic-nucleotide 2'-phosphodiesterase (5'-nucleotidase family)